jgi:predicted transcriptional regulator
MTTTETETSSRELDTLRLSLLSGDLLDSLPAPESLLEGILSVGTLAAIYGPSGIGKSFVAQGIALSVSTGSRWMGRQVRQGPVLYVAAEGSFGLAQRRRAWMTSEQLSATEGDHWLVRSVNLLDLNWSTALVELAKELRPVLIVVDTVARSMQGGEENSSRDMGTLINAADAIRHATGATVLLVHHTPRQGDNMRGHTSLEGAVDTAIEVQGDEHNLVLRCAKQKDAAPFEDIRLSLRVVGDSCVVGDPFLSETKITEIGRRMLETLDETDLGDGISPTRWQAVSGVGVSSAFRWQKTLVTLGYCQAVGDGKRKLYTLTEQGRELLGGLETPNSQGTTTGTLEDSRELLPTPHLLDVGVGSNGGSERDRADLR